MYNATKFLIIAAIAAALLACSGDSARKEAAAQLVAKARSFTDTHQYDSAMVVLDTLNIRYRDCLDARREGTIVRLTALSALTRDSLAADEIQLHAVNSEIDGLGARFKKIDLEGTDGYYVDKETYTGNEMNTTGIQVRIDDKGYCFIVANVAGRRIGLNRIAFGDVSTPPSGSIEVEGSEIMSVTQEPATALLNALSESNEKTTVTLSGSKGKVDVAITPKQREAISATWRYARALQQQRLLNIRLEKLERQLARLSDQLANQTPVPEE